MQMIGDGLRDALDPYSRATGSVEDDEGEQDEKDGVAGIPEGHDLLTRPRA